MFERKLCHLESKFNAGSRIPESVNVIGRAKLKIEAVIIDPQNLPSFTRLCRSGQLSAGNLLPVSVAMQQNEAEYLRVLRAYSAEARERWEVLWIDDDNFDFQFGATDDIYRFWDATACVEFGFQMSELALEDGLKREAKFLACFDEIRRRIEAEFDVRSADLSPLIVMCLDNAGVVSKHRRKQYVGRLPDALFDSLEKIAADVLAH